MSAAGCRCRFQRTCGVLLVGAALSAGWLGTAWGPAAALAKHAARAPHAIESIVGGASAQIADFPFQVALYDPAAGSPMAGFFCGGVIVDQTHVITAAHCLSSGGGHGQGGVASEIEVLAGSTRLDRLEPGSVEDPAAAVSIDPNYDPATNDYDIGIVTLARPLWSSASPPPVNGSSTIAPLQIEPAAAERYGKPGEPNAGVTTYATVSGWGDVNPAPSDAPSYPAALRSVEVPLVSEAECQEQYASIELTITPRMICAGGSRPRADSCYGDSGGPLVVDRDSPARPPADYVLVGLVDFGEGCAQPGYPGVYVRIDNSAIVNYLASGVGVGARAAAPHPARKKNKRRHRHHLPRHNHRAKPSNQIS